ncbi:GNAT family N-acetyltransferase [Terrimonas pollutisoli]|uniref:GNAT family N-acetyltransferase n=1 Tax=Terrimonas pollutisoli TaxID=3034147 RepID=UPI0023EB0BD2|nr:GNAT family N-acetyltransferase [Terrimonas sp. H1YJ31]
MISIRFATGGDAELIADMSRQTFYDTFASQNTVEDMNKFLNEQFTREALIQEVNTKDNIFLLAYDQEEPVGYARLRENNNPPSLGSANAIELARIYATSNSIGKGVGKALMEKCIGLAERGKKDFIWLGVWEKNQRAIDFYIRWGFEKFADHDFVLGNDVQKDWLMKKKI